MPPDVDIREIRAFLVLSEELRFARAADRLGVTASRVSQMIRSLETRIGAGLFERTSRRVHLTPAGELLLSEVAHPYRELHEALARAREAAGDVMGALRIGLYSLLSGGPYMADIVKTFKARHPSCAVDLINIGYDRSYLDVLRSGQVDVLATRLPLSSSLITVGPVLSREERVVLVATDDPLARRDGVSYEDLVDYAVSDVPAFPREVMDAFIPPVTPSGRTLRRIPNHSAEDTMMRVALGEQVHPTVRSFLDHHSHPDVTCVPIRDLPPSETALIWLTANGSGKTLALARAAHDVLIDTELASPPALRQL